MVSPEFPRRVVIPEYLQLTSDPISKNSEQAEADRVHEALSADLRAQVVEKGWDPADVEATIEIVQDGRLFERNEFRFVMEARHVPRPRP